MEKITCFEDDIVRWEPSEFLIGPNDPYSINKTQQHRYEIYIKKDNKIRKFEHTVDYKELKDAYLKDIELKNMGL